MTSEVKESVFFYISFCLLALLRASFLGFSYTPYLDDYVQYFYYPTFNDPLNRILLGGAGTLFSRPLAGLFDFYFWSLFQSNLFAAVLIIFFLHGISALIFQSALSKLGVSAGKIFLANFVFCPLNTEAVYWLSASSRIVVSMFFTALALNFLLKNRHLLYSLFCFLSFWFYEQTALISFALLSFVCIKTKKPIWALVPIFSLSLLGIYYLAAGRMGDNAGRISSLNLGAILPQTASVLAQCKNIFLKTLPLLLGNGFIRSFKLMASPVSLLNFAAMTGLVVVFFKSGLTLSKTNSKATLLLGILLSLTPLAPFFVLEDSFIQLRNISPCLLGLSILADYGVSKICKKWTSHIATVLVLVFMLCWVSEVNDYKITADHDKALASKISQSVTSDTVSVTVSPGLPKYLPQNAPYGDHIMSIVGSDWGLTGVVRTLSGNKNVRVKQK